ncbi:MAG TPA: cation:proton antiporter, partial [Saprospiraceae bacterium]|nr:cation:proton antiporter [Saprospiraceae bacterium]
YLYELDEVAWEALILSLALIFIARPLGTVAALSPFRRSGRREKVFLSWVGLRGATPIVFALIPLVMHVPFAHKIFNVSFIIVIVSMLLQGTTVGWMARFSELEDS